MTDDRRKTIAFICGMHFAEVTHTNIYDYTRASYFFLDYSVNGQEISVYDYERKCYVSGRFSSLYDYGVSRYMDFRVEREDIIDVYDYLTGSNLQVTCRGNDVSLFDYKAGRYFEYQLS